MFHRYRLPAFLLFGLFLLVVGSPPAVAHVTVVPAEASAGSRLHVAFRVPHGCDGEATLALRLRIPEGVRGVRPKAKPGWEITISSDGGGAVEEIAWRGGPLPDAWFDEFDLLLVTPQRPGETLYFPVVQECETGVHHWIDIPASGEDPATLAEPAPFLRLTEPEVGGHHGHDHGHGDGHGHAHD
jgi:periplasmic copper chaperone A